MKISQTYGFGSGAGRGGWQTNAHSARSLITLAAMVAIAVALSSCGSGVDGPVSLIDLVADFEVADPLYDTAEIGPPVALEPGAKPADGPQIGWWTDYSGQILTIRPHFTASKDLTMTVYMNVGGLALAKAGEIEILFNGSVIERKPFSDLPDTPEVRIDIDKKHVRAGRNEIIFERRRAADYVGKPGATLREHIKGVAFASEDSKTAPRKASYEAVPADGDSPATLSIPSSGAIDYYYSIAPGSTLRFTLRPGGKCFGPKVRITVTREGDGKEIEKSYTVPFLMEKKVALDLSDFEGEIARISMKAPDGKITLDDPHIAWPDVPSADNVAENSVERVESASRNVVVFLLDSLAACHLDCYGNKRKTSPNISELAAESVVFDKYFANAAYTLASTTSLFTSQYPITHGVLGRGDMLSDSALTLAERLRDHGVSTAMFTANDYASATVGLDQGFETYVEMYETYDLDENIVWAEKFVPAFLDWAKTQEEPFFGYLHMVQPHLPYTPPAPYDTAFDDNSGFDYDCDAAFLIDVDNRRRGVDERDVAHIRAQYDENILYIDRQIGEIVRGLEDLGILDETTVILLSDHGEAFMQHGYMLHNQTVFHEMIHVPLIIRFPSKDGIAPRRIESLATTVDIMPTVLDLFRAPYYEGEFAGKSLLSDIAVDAPEGRSAFSRIAFSMTVARKAFSFDDGKRKRIIGHFEHFYDPERDPEETEDLLYAEPVLAGYYRQLTLDYIREYSIIAGFGNVEKALLDQATIDRLKALGYLDN